MWLLFTTVPLYGHFHPLVPLAWAARSLGHDVLVATTENFAPAVARTGLPVVSWGPAADFVSLADEASGPQGPERDSRPAHGSAERRLAHGRAFGRLAERNIPGALALFDAWQPDLVVSERAESAGPLVADKYGVPHVEFHWGAAELPEYREGAAAGLGLDPPAPAETLNPWPPGLRLPYAAGHRAVRNIDFSGGAELPPWSLRAPARPRVCVTFGTVIPRIADLALRATMTPVLRRLAGLDLELLVAADEETLAAWPELGRCAHHAGRLPMAQLLPSCDLLVNHGGQGTVLAALSAGCPQLLLPHFDDQFDNAGLVHAAGAGVCLPPERITADTVVDLVHSLVEDATCAAAAARLADESARQPSLPETVHLLAELAGRR